VKIERNKIEFFTTIEEIIELNLKLNSIPKLLENAEIHFNTLMLIFKNDIESVRNEYLAKLMYNHNPQHYDFYRKCYELVKNYTEKKIN
jgi:hypothetical protein